MQKKNTFNITSYNHCFECSAYYSDLSSSICLCHSWRHLT